MKRNVGTIDALFRIAFGLFGLAWGISKMVSNPRRKFPFFIAFLSGQKVAEGITRFCPGLAAFGLNTTDLERTGTREQATNRASHEFGSKIKQAPRVASYGKEDKGALYD